MKKENSINEQVKALVDTINALPTKERTEFIFNNLEDELKNVKVGEKDSIYGLIYVTKDLTQFKSFEGNRIINENSQIIEKLADSIRNHGVHIPVLTNEEFKVADGQRRITAIRHHGLPNAVPYFREKGVTIDDVSDMNVNLAKWGWRDHLHKYEMDNREDYVEYAKLAVHWEKLMKSRSLRGLLMFGRVDALPSDTWERGQFHIDHDNLPMVRRFMEILEKVYIIGDRDNLFARDRNFQKSLYNMYSKTPKLDINRLLVKLKTFFNQINIKTDYKGYNKVLAEIYNRRLTGDKHHVIIDSDEEPTHSSLGNTNRGSMRMN